MNIFIVYTIFLFSFFFINLLFIKLRLYSQEKYKVSISLFVAFNVLLTAYILLKQMTNHEEEITNILTKYYTDYCDNMYGNMMKRLEDNKINSKLCKELFTFDNDIVGNKIYKNLANNVEYNVEYNAISIPDKSICLEINCSISNYALFYYTHIELADYIIKIKRQNYRILKIINWYLRSPTYNIILINYLNGTCGLFTLKYFKEFFNISQINPIVDQELKIAKNTIIDGKLNGTETVVAPTTYTNNTFKDDLKSK